MTKQEIEIKLKNLENAFYQSLKNNDLTIKKADDTSKEVKTITPYMESKKAYIGDTSYIFNGVREGNVTAYIVTDSGLAMPTTIARYGDSVVVSFEKLEEVATVTISVV